MRGTLAIAGKELRIYFTTPLAYVMLSMFTFVGSWIFLWRVGEFTAQYHQAMNALRPDIVAQMNLTDWVVTPLVVWLGILLFFIVPFLTMRLVAEERSKDTFELLMTTPIRPIAIVMGKYLAALGLLLIALFLTLLYPLLLSIFGSGDEGAVEWPTVWSGYLGLSLMGAGLMAAGLFVSTLTRSQAVAALVTLVFALLMSIVTFKAPELSGTAREVFLYLSAGRHLENFASGRLSLASVSYFASYVVLGLFLTHRSLEGQRWAA
ncbi:MAG: ABC transporter permease [Deltaproteobacteria bacterium]|nr:MAG: ABC transporter permease [Deltaproteobacteria bacterium]